MAQCGETRARGGDGAYDVIVVGFGAAGACAAIEAAEQGARVLLIDRFFGGGATARSGGIVYLGGGTALQKAAGYDDDPEQMFRYLQYEGGGAHDEPTLRAFCNESLTSLAFLETLGVPFPPSRDTPRTSYPDDDCTLYFSGNELAPPYSEGARPAPRGHRVLGKGITGDVLFRHLRAGVKQRSIDVWLCSEARELVVNSEGAVEGLVVRRLDASPRQLRRYRRLFRLGSDGAILHRGLASSAGRRLDKLCSRHGRLLRLRARRAVVLCAGGFVFNPEMMRAYAPAYTSCNFLAGTLGDDGSGIELGRSVGGATGQMDRCAAWRFINPPVSCTHGVLIGANGRRVCNEELYGGKLGERIALEHAGRAWLVIDARVWKTTWDELVASRKLGWQNITALINLLFNRRKATSLPALAEACGVPAPALQETIERYNQSARGGGPDEFGKTSAACQPLETPPFYAIRCHLDSRCFPAASMTLGGLRVEGRTGRVLRADGSAIDGLYAAGRNAAGISSYSYISGLSLADCIFSGRRAGRHAASAGSRA
jgi:3-oxo-5alpha-steroid 4-dehydrogenase